MIHAMSDSSLRLAAALEQAHDMFILVVTGAGVSAPSGLPTFRGDEPEAIWSRDVTEIATFEFFRREPVASWLWYLRTFGNVMSAKPNAAHLALAEIEEWQTAGAGDFLLITQNIDTLHEQAGSRRFVKIHGSCDRARCSRYGCRYGSPSGSLPMSEVDLETLDHHPKSENLPRCPACGSVIRPHALLFDELYREHDDYGFDRVQEAAARMELLLFVGTSFSVGITDLLVSAARARRVATFSIDPAVNGPLGVVSIREHAEKVLPDVAHQLRHGGNA
jgi:NAD-dependent protein deacetylases, SIR2 family